MRAARILLALVSFIGFAPAQEPVAHPDKLAAIEPAMRKFVESGDLSGAVTVVGRKNGIIHHEATGQRNAHRQSADGEGHTFRIASMTKPITAIGIMILRTRESSAPMTMWRSICPSSPVS